MIIIAIQVPYNIGLLLKIIKVCTIIVNVSRILRHVYVPIGWLINIHEITQGGKLVELNTTQRELLSYLQAVLTGHVSAKELGVSFDGMHSAYLLEGINI